MNNYKKLVKIGNSTGVILPKDFLRHKQASAGDTVEFIVRNIIKRVK